MHGVVLAKAWRVIRTGYNTMSTVFPSYETDAVALLIGYIISASASLSLASPCSYIHPSLNAGFLHRVDCY